MKFNHLFFIITAILMVNSSSFTQEAVKSWNKLTTGNGFNISIYNTSSHKVDTFMEHIYSQYSESSNPSIDFCYDTYFGVRQNTTNIWLNTISEEFVGYVDKRGNPGTGIIKTVQKALSYQIETYYFSPFSIDSNILVALIKVTNIGNSTNGAIFVLMNFHTGPNGDSTSESITYSNGTFIETGNYSMVYKSILPPSAYSATTGVASNNPWKLVNQNKVLDNKVLSGKNDDMVAAFQYDFNLAKNESIWYGIVIGFDSRGSSYSLSKIEDYIGDSSPKELLDNEFDEWDKWHQNETIPDGLSKEELNLFKQSLAILRMAQNREEGKGKGQILASLPPGIWNISWVRDASYAIAGLVYSNHQEEAKNALLFMLNSDAGSNGQDYSSYVGISNYRISVCRYYGNGDEWSDGGDDPNIEFDNFGLFLWALGIYTGRYGMDDIVKPYWPIIKSEIADVLVSLIEVDNLLKADSSIWERHWYSIDGGRKKFAFTNICAVAGLREAQRFASYMGDDSKSQSYKTARDKIVNGIKTYLVTNDNVLKSCKEESSNYYDASSVEAFNFIVIDPLGDIAKATLNAIEKYLPAPYPESPGYKRNDDGSSYDNKEWINIDLRASSAWRALGEETKANDLLNWITEQSVSNYYIMAELYDQYGRYDGSIPMCGYGPGAYILSLFKTETIPLIPQNVEGTVNNRVVTITWEKNEDPYTIFYNVYKKSTQNGNYKKVNTLPIIDTSYSDNSPSYGKISYYAVTALNKYGQESGYSSQVTVVVDDSYCGSGEINKYENIKFGVIFMLSLVIMLFALNKK